MHDPQPRLIEVSEHSERLHLRYQHDPQRLVGTRLWVQGLCAIEDFERPAIAIVGTRKPTAYGIRFVREFVAALRSWDVTILSGGALGIDGEAHLAALKNGLPTHAWLVGPLSDPNPRFHRYLFERMLNTPGCGLIVPEALEPDGLDQVHKGDWIKRNQWLAAAADALVVVEAKRPSGTWSTVKAADDFGLAVHLLPGPISSLQSEGINQMIAEGYGHPILNIQQLVETLVGQLRPRYNRIRDPELDPGPGGASTDHANRPLNAGLLESLRTKLNQPSGLNLEGLLAISSQASPEEVLRHLHWMLVEGEIRRSGDHFERRG